MSSGSSAPALGPFWDRPATSGVFSDYDGTLAPIVADPASARAFPGAIEVLTDLVDLVGRVGVVSGRPARFLLHHLGGRGIYLSGLYGLETVDPRTDSPAFTREALPWAPVVEEVANRAEGAAGAGGVPEGVSVERKGLALTLHFRSDPTLESAARGWAEAEARRTGLTLHMARMAFELRPPVPTSKGTALLAGAQGLDPVCFIGDDYADLEAFDALDSLADSDVTVVRVAVTSEEGPPDLMTRADLVVEGPAGAVALLEDLLHGLR